MTGFDTDDQDDDFTANVPRSHGENPYRGDSENMLGSDEDEDENVGAAHAAMLVRRRKRAMARSNPFFESEAAVADGSEEDSGDEVESEGNWKDSFEASSEEIEESLSFYRDANNDNNVFPDDDEAEEPVPVPVPVPKATAKATVKAAAAVKPRARPKNPVKLKPKPKPKQKPKPVVNGQPPPPQVKTPAPLVAPAPELPELPRHYYTGKEFKRKDPKKNQSFEIIELSDFLPRTYIGSIDANGDAIIAAVREMPLAQLSTIRVYAPSTKAWDGYFKVVPIHVKETAESVERICFYYLGIDLETELIHAAFMTGDRKYVDWGQFNGDAYLKKGVPAISSSLYRTKCNRSQEKKQPGTTPVKAAKREIRTVAATTTTPKRPAETAVGAEPPQKRPKTTVEPDTNGQPVDAKQTSINTYMVPVKKAVTKAAGVVDQLLVLNEMARQYNLKITVEIGQVH